MCAYFRTRTLADNGSLRGEKIGSGSILKAVRFWVRFFSVESWGVRFGSEMYVSLSTRPVGTTHRVLKIRGRPRRILRLGRKVGYEAGVEGAFECCVTYVEPVPLKPTLTRQIEIFWCCSLCLEIQQTKPKT